MGTIASAVTLAALFKLCIEAFDAIHTASNQALDLRKLGLKLKIEKCRLYIWGEAMGFTLTHEDHDEAAKPFDACPYPELVQETLSLILDLFQDSQKLKKKYGCVSQDSQGSTSLEQTGSSDRVLSQLNAPFNNFKVRSSKISKETSIARKALWVIKDRTKFESLIVEAKYFVDGLQGITKDIKSTTAQEGTMSSRIRSICDVRTLDWVSEVCEVDYPALSDAASFRADTISDSSHFHRDIRDWKDAIPSDEDDKSDDASVDTAIAGLEDLTVTELKHKLSSFLLEARTSRLQVEESNRELQYPEPNANTKRYALLNFDITSDGTKADVDQVILESMYEYSTDNDFKAEQDAIVEWFKVLNLAEAATVFYNLGETISKVPDLARFFARIQTYREKSIGDAKTSRGDLFSKTRMLRSSLRAFMQTDGPDPKSDRASSKPLPPSPDLYPLLPESQKKSSKPVITANQRVISDSLVDLLPSYSNFLKSHKSALSETVLLQRDAREKQEQNRRMSLHELKLQQTSLETKANSGPSLLKTASSETLRPG